MSSLCDPNRPALPIGELLRCFHRACQFALSYPSVPTGLSKGLLCCRNLLSRSSARRTTSACMPQVEIIRHHAKAVLGRCFARRIHIRFLGQQALEQPRAIPLAPPNMNTRNDGCPYQLCNCVPRLPDARATSSGRPLVAEAPCGHCSAHCALVTRLRVHVLHVHSAARPRLQQPVCSAHQ